MPDCDYEYRGFLLVIDKGEPYQRTCVEKEIPVPKSLQGKWTRPEVLENAINQYWLSRELTETNSNLSKGKH
jgi:hypothetical protein